jgi:sugar transferase EpsL
MYKAAKRALDLGVAGLGMVVLLPVLLVVAAAAWLGGLRPVLFKQWRTGYREQPFQLLKFCTMTQQRDAVGHGAEF